MSEDSWSSSDNSSDAGSASGSSDSSSASSEPTSGGWGEASGEVVGRVLGDLLEPSAVTPSTYATGTSSGGGLLNPALQALFLAGDGQPAVEQRSLVRRIVEGARWYLPTTATRALEYEAISSTDDQVRAAFSAPLGHGRPARKRLLPRGRPFHILRAWPEQPGRPALELSGRALARQLPSDLDGLLLMHEMQPALGLWREEFALLTQLADSLDLEDTLLHPAPGQLAALQTARWYVRAGKRRYRTVTWGFDALIRVCTHPDSGYEDDHPMQEVSGRALCAALVAPERHNRFDGIAIGMGTVRDYDQEDIRLGLGVVRGIASGTDTRIGAAPLPARTRAEIDLWMEITGFPWKDRELIPVDDAPDTVQARSSMASNWRPYETSVSPPRRPAPTLGPLFTISQPDARPGDLGEGQTRMLCAGLLAQYLYEKSPTHDSGWHVSKQQRIRAAKLAGVALELQKLLVPGQEHLPRSSILTIAGASFLRRRREYSARGWIEKLLARHHRTATYWLPSLR